MSTRTGMRPALRLARREILRHRWRSLLVVILIGLPILASVAAVTLVETGQISDREARPYTYGSARAQVIWGSSAPEETGPGDSAGPATPTTEAEALSALEAATDLPVIPHTWLSAWAAQGQAGWRVNLLRTDFGSPLAHGLVDTVTGHLPRRPDEIAVTPALAHAGATIGSTLTLGEAELTVVGVVRSFARDVDVDKAVMLPVDSAADPATSPVTGRFDVPWTFLVGDADTPLTDAERTRLSNAGFETIDRDALDAGDSMAAPSSEDASLMALLITCLLIEIVLLAGPAFAVGVRRQRHTLALLAVAGGSPRDIRRTVLAQGLLLGLGGAVAGAALSIPLTWLGLRVVEAGWGLALGPFDIGWLAILPAIAFGTLSAVLASLIPARLASKVDVVTALAGRQPTPRVRRGWPVAGLIVLAVGTLGSLASVRHEYGGGDLQNAWWAVVSVCGAVMMTPWLIATIARLAPRLPLPLRLALRDADRHRSRSAPAVAAVMASVSAVVALGIGSGSDTRQEDRDYEYAHPLGTVTLETDAGSMPAIVDAVKQGTGVTFTPLVTLNDWSVEPPAVDPDQWSSWSVPTSVAVADAPTLEAWGVSLDPAAKEALASGRGLVDGGDQGSGTVAVTRWSEDANGQASSIDVPTLATDLRVRGPLPKAAVRPTIAGLVVSPETAADLGLVDPDNGDGAWITAVADRPASQMDESAVEAAAATVTPDDWAVYVTDRHRSPYWLLLLLLSALGAFTVLLGTFSATGLALDDARQDLTTLSAVGARPRTRRVVAGTHALLIAFVGSVLGIAVGFTPGVAAAYLLTNSSSEGWVFSVPWLLLLILVIVLPIVAGVVTAVVSRTRTLSLRRAA
ncbi:MAG: FtsX-like permease family protein [Nocardioides sp.]|uniref:FtsX-like permease family protein n=1 Tax=Nocardioides sp. TaxID=35761 RepID=UPI0039E61BDF